MQQALISDRTGGHCEPDSARHRSLIVGERDPALGYELFKRITPVMLKRLQAARRRLLSVHAHGTTLEPAGRELAEDY